MTSLRQTPVLVSDFDGTMTRYDFYRLALAKLVPPGTPDYWEDYLVDRLTHFEALRRIFAHIRADEATVLATAREMEVDPTLPEAAARLTAAGWEIEIASAGCDWYIRHLLAANHMTATLYANPGYYNSTQGLIMELPTDSPFYSPSTGIDKEAVVRHALQHHDCVAFAGDGRPDLPAALLVPPSRRFARGWLAEALSVEGIPFHPFEHWSEIVDILLDGAGRC